MRSLQSMGGDTPLSRRDACGKSPPFTSGRLDRGDFKDRLLLPHKTLKGKIRERAVRKPRQSIRVGGVLRSLIPLEILCGWG